MVSGQCFTDKAPAAVVVPVSSARTAAWRDRPVLVQAVRRVDGRGAVPHRGRAVPRGVVGIGMENRGWRMENGVCHLGAVVVGSQRRRRR